jgi:hypothetical protein
MHLHRDSQFVPIKVGKSSNWLVVSTHLKNISQWEGLSHILWEIKNVPNHQPGKSTYRILWSHHVPIRIAKLVTSPRIRGLKLTSSQRHSAAKRYSGS